MIVLGPTQIQLKFQGDLDHRLNTKIIQILPFTYCIGKGRSYPSALITSVKEVMFSPRFVCPSVCL